MDLDALAKRIRNGDTQAAAELVSRYGKMVYYNACAEAGDEDRAERVTKHTFSELLASLRRNEIPDDLTLYLQKQVRIQSNLLDTEDGILASMISGIRRDPPLPGTTLLDKVEGRQGDEVHSTAVMPVTRVGEDDRKTVEARGNGVMRARENAVPRGSDSPVTVSIPEVRRIEGSADEAVTAADAAPVPLTAGLDTMVTQGPWTGKGPNDPSRTVELPKVALEAKPAPPASAPDTSKPASRASGDAEPADDPAVTTILPTASAAVDLPGDPYFVDSSVTALVAAATADLASRKRGQETASPSEPAAEPETGVGETTPEETAPEVDVPEGEACKEGMCGESSSGEPRSGQPENAVASRLTPAEALKQEEDSIIASIRKEVVTSRERASSSAPATCPVSTSASEDGNEITAVKVPPVGHAILPADLTDPGAGDATTGSAAGEREQPGQETVDASRVPTDDSAAGTGALETQGSDTAPEPPESAGSPSTTSLGDTEPNFAPVRVTGQESINTATAPDEELEDKSTEIHHRFYGEADSVGATSRVGFAVLVAVTVLLALLVVWLVIGFLVKFGAILPVDLGYSWFDTHVYPMF